MKKYIEKRIMLVSFCMFLTVHLQSQHIRIKTDEDCMLIINGRVHGELKADKPNRIPVTKGEHVIVAVTPDKGFHFRDVVTVNNEGLHELNIAFQPKINFQKERQGIIEKRMANIKMYSSQKKEITREIAENMVLISEGTFKIGSSNGDKDEKPVREVFLEEYFISKYEVTQKQWMGIMGNNPSYFHECENCPVEGVHWYDAVLFCNVLSDASGLGPYYIIDSTTTDTNNHNFYDHMKWVVSINDNAKGYRLPTEAEWEHAAANFSDFIYAGSDSVDKVAWTLFSANGFTHPVGQKQPNDFGLYDMSGNVWEWCYDWYSRDYYEKGENKNPKGTEKGGLRVIRGGGWKAHPAHARVSNRGKEGADNTTSFTGFRIVRNR